MDEVKDKEALWQEEAEKLADEYLAPVPLETEDDYDAALERIVVPAPKGYGDNYSHTFMAETHAALKRNMEGGDFDEQAFIEMQRDTIRSALKLSLALDSQRALGEEAKAAIDMAEESKQIGYMEDARLKAMSAMSAYDTSMRTGENPESATIEALIVSDSPYTIEEETKNALILHDESLFAISKRVGDRKLVDFSFDNTAVDLLVHFPNPIRQFWGIRKFSVSQKEGWFGYFDVLKKWNTLSAKERRLAFPEIEEAAWEAAGTNSLVYASIIMPFVYDQDEVWTKFSLIADAADTVYTTAQIIKLGKYLLSLNRMKNAAKLVERSLKPNERALARGNKQEAGEATVRGIKAKDGDSVKEGHPIDFSKAEPELASAEVKVPTELSIEKRAREAGLVDDGQELFIKVKALSPDEIEEGLEETRKLITSKGAVITKEEMVGPYEVQFTITNPTEVQVPLHTITEASKRAASDLKRLKNQLKLLTKDTDPLSNLEEKKQLTTYIDVLKEQQKALKKARTAAKSAKTPTGPMVGDEQRVVNYSFTVDDAGVGMFKEKEGVGLYGTTIGTPETRLGKMHDSLVSLTTLMRQQQRRVFGLFDKPVRKTVAKLRSGRVLRALGKDSRYNVESLLLHGDTNQKVYSAAELEQGISIPSLGHVKFNEKEIAAYKEIRTLYDDLWVVANNMQVEEYRFAGFSQFWINQYKADGTTLLHKSRIFAKARSGDVGFAVPKVGDNEILKTLDTSTGEVVELSKVADLQQGLKERRYGFVELKDDFIQGDGTHYSHALVHVDNTVGDLFQVKYAQKVDSVLDYRKGYVPKMVGERVSHLVVMPRKVVRNGVKTGDYRILRAFNSRREAEIFLQRFAAKHPKVAPEKMPYIEATGGEFRKNPKYANMVKQLDERLFRGAFVGHRNKTSKFKMGLESRIAERVNPFEAIQRYSDFVAMHYPMHEWKQAMIERFSQMAKRKEGGSWLDIPSRWDSKIKDDAPNRRELKAIQDNMRVAFSVPTTQEMQLHKVQNELMRTLDYLTWNTKEGRLRRGGKVTGRIRNTLANSRSFTDPWQAMKGVTFEMMMGFWNIRQIVIQTAGMFIPATLHPLEAAMSIPEFFFLRSAQTAATDINQFAKGAKVVGLNSAKMNTLMRAWFRSGIPESILENADFGYYQGMHGSYYVSPALLKAKKFGRFFYNAGELNNRAFSFTLAFNRKAQEHGWDVTKTLTDDQLFEVVKEANRIGTNLGPANAAKWQNLPILGLKTQFWQQWHKYGENLLYGLVPESKRAALGLVKENQWTNREAINALITNMLAFGAAGYGIDEGGGLKAMLTEYDEWVIDPNGLGLDPQKDKALITFLRGGIVETMSYFAFGYPVDISDNIGPASGYTMAVEAIGEYITAINEARTGGNPDLTLKMLIGASANIGTRWGTAMSETLTLLNYDSEGIDWDGTALYAVLSNLAGMTSGWTNAEKARLWRSINDVTGKDGKPLYIVEEGQVIPKSVLFNRLFGFDPLVAEQKYAMINQQARSEKELAKITKRVIEARRKFLSYDGKLAGDELEREINRRVIATLLQDLSFQEYAKVMNQVNQTLDNEFKDTFESKLFKAILEKTAGSKEEEEAAQRLHLNQTLTLPTQEQSQDAN